MATYTAEKGAILQPGNQINRLSSFNTEGVYAWPGLEFYELVGYFKVDSTTSVTSGDLIVPSPDRRSSDRVRDDRTSMVIQASTDRPAYIIGRVNYVRPAAAATFADIQGFIDFASQVGGNDE